VPVGVFKKAMLQIFYKHFEHEKWTGMNNWFILCAGFILEDKHLLKIV
jgi:hypothetical protein